MELRIHNLSKSYGPAVKALDAVSLTIPQGMFGLLGPNGSGKSTLMRIIATLLDPDSGEIHFGPIDVVRQKDDVRRQLGYLPQEFGVYPRLSVLDTLDHLAVLKGVLDRKVRREQIESLLHRVNLYDARKRALSGFSGGMRQRFGIAQALLGNPQLIIVDEPTAGLDPGERNRFYDLLSEISEERVVILSTHIVEDVKELCSNLAIIHHGRVLYCGGTREGLTALEGKVWKKIVARQEFGDLAGRYRVIAHRGVQGRVSIHVFSAADPGDGFQPVEADIEDLFFSKIGGLV
jgi:ABC-2 type transport system ATP-binding protein